MAFLPSTELGLLGSWNSTTLRERSYLVRFGEVHAGVKSNTDMVAW
jgi:hypothetical protein